MPQPLVSIRKLALEASTTRGTAHILRGIDLDIGRGRILGVVGESGSGKSSLAACLVRLLPANLSRISGAIVFDGTDLLALDEAAMNAYRGTRVAMIFQDPMTALNPVLTIGHQIGEAIKTHFPDVKRGEIKSRVVTLLELVGVPNPETRYDQYPHEFSGGMRQRAMIAMSIANSPSLLIADEPTTALDVTIQAQVLEVMKKVMAETHAATILITHDLGIVAEMCDRVIVMYGGRVVESGDVNTIFRNPRHPYTIGLMNSLPTLTEDEERLEPIPGAPPSLINLPSGCAFHPRCFHSNGRDQCRTDIPQLVSAGDGHAAACHFSDELAGFQSKYSKGAA